MLAGLVRASGELPKLQKRAVGTIHDEFVSQFTDLFPVMNVVGNPKENSKTMRLTSITPGQHQKHYCSLLERASCSLLAPHTWNTLVPVLSSSEGFQALFERVPGQAHAPIAVGVQKASALQGLSSLHRVEDSSAKPKLIAPGLLNLCVNDTMGFPPPPQQMPQGLPRQTCRQTPSFLFPVRVHKDNGWHEGRLRHGIQSIFYLPKCSKNICGLIFSFSQALEFPGPEPPQGTAKGAVAAGAELSASRVPLTKRAKNCSGKLGSTGPEPGKGSRARQAARGNQYGKEVNVLKEKRHFLPDHQDLEGELD
ncbi:hypothetical protein Anapl_06901 [Anas platyrhynchos]|uniref:Uncharacterized protein n=1 Tax=Anas platyrhynchos TaxID=8839 RepID=R0LEZ8_ANAPL|nr:hypothetical protein Anapl_06901 [Anas platyrhynchos]